MFVNGVQVISSRLENITLDISKMQPKPERPVVSKADVPKLHLTPSHLSSTRVHCSPEQTLSNPCLLKPQHEIPPTPPPQANTQPPEFFPKRFG
ncbi:uncharacterized protein LOC125488612 [Plutella xylostella]|uniref:uncharacterized protein LOC125488612 n=1 Tax=Plutella xylostella TaxID=51655 RepID=UPI002032B739|nr:uncharacterized protein LOC125488612 [Plutella xylostella]